MKNDTCVICGEKFNVPRESKLYCSDSCKQTAYERKKKEKEDTLVKVETAIENEVVKTNKIIIFSMPEFNEVMSKLNDEISKKLDFYKYFFIRKSLSGKPNIEEIIKYLMLYEDKIKDDYFYDKNFDDNFIYENYQKFIKEFHDESKYQIIVSKE